MGKIEFSVGSSGGGLANAGKSGRMCKPTYREAVGNTFFFSLKATFDAFSGAYRSPIKNLVFFVFSEQMNYSRGFNFLSIKFLDYFGFAEKTILATNEHALFTNYLKLFV